MKHQIKKIVGVLLIMGLLMALVACKDLNESVGSGDSSSESGDSTEPITLTLFSGDPNSSWENMQSPVGKKITELTGVTIQPEWDVNGGDQKIALMAASGQYPDLIMPKGSAGTLVEAGALIDLTDLIEEHAPNLKKVYGDYMDRLKYSEEDPSIYILPYTPVDHEYWSPGNAFMLQHDVVKELGYPELKTLKDFENAIKAYKEKNPTIDGQPTIGLSLLADDWRIMISTTNPAFWATGAPDDGEYYIDPETYEATMHYRRPEEKEYFRWLNHMNDIGLLDPESFVQKYDQYLAKISSGRVLGLADADWQVGDAIRALREAGMHERMYGMYPLQLTEDTKHRNFQDTGYLGGWGTGISVDAKDPVRAIKFLDFLASDEGQLLNNWGIEGEHYTVVDGKRVISAEEMDKRNNDSNYAKNTGIGVLKGLAPSYGDGVVDSTGNTYTIASPTQITESYTDVEKDVLKNYGVEMWRDLFAQKEDFPVKDWGAAWNIPIPSSSDLGVINQRCLDIVKKRVPEAILASPDKFDQIWDDFMKDLEKAGVEKAEAEYTELVKQRVTFWGN